MDSPSTLRAAVAIILIICVGITGFMSGQVAAPTLTTTLTEKITTTKMLQPQTITEKVISTTTTILTKIIPTTITKTLTVTLTPPIETVTFTPLPVTETVTVTAPPITVTKTITITATPTPTLTVFVEKDNYYHAGDTLNIYGSATANAWVTIQLFDPAGNRMAISQVQASSTGIWLESGLYTFGTGDPLGTWHVKVFDSATGKTAETTFKLI